MGPIAPRILSGMALAAITAASACAERPGGVSAETSGPLVRDSAGIQIVESSQPVWGDGEGWTIDPAPILTIGEREGEQPYLFQSVAGAAVTASGGVVVAEAGDQTLRLFDGSGTHLRSFGGRGEGPTEFTSLRGITAIGEEVWGYQRTGGFVAAKGFSVDGELIESVPMPQIENLVSLYVAGVFGGGSMLVRENPQGRPPAGGVYDDDAFILRAYASGRVDTLMVMPGERYATVPVQGGEVGLRQLWGPRLFQWVRPDRFYMGWGEDAEIGVYDPDGALIRLVRWDAVRQPVTEDERAAYFAELERNPPGNPQYPAMMAAMTLPEFLPAHASIYASEDGHIWAERVRFTELGEDWMEPRVFEVFDVDGAWLGAVELPSDLAVLEVRSDYVLGLTRGEYDVPQVTMHRIVKGGG